jgi:Mg-chelatase subunit ChlD
VGVGAGGGMAGGGSFDNMLQTLRRNGLDVVIAFDSTGSMTGEINEVKEQIRKIGTTMLTLVPKTRFSLCTYRDAGDSYVAKGIPLTSDIRQLEYFLKGVEAGGGGDHPEAVQEGLKWAMENNKFRASARKVILVFGDAPPHADDQAKCLKLAKNFRGQEKGIVSTVTCRAKSPMPEFYAIADAGGGEAFLATDSRQIVSQLVILVFGSQHKDKVLEAFKLLEK